MKVSASVPVSAADPAAKIGIRPLDVHGAFFDLMMHPGEVRQLRVELDDFGSAPITAATFAADAYTMNDGGMAVRAKNEPTSGTTGWLDYASSTLGLAPGSTVVRSFSVAVPAATAPGDYVSAIVVLSEAPLSTSGSVAFNQIVRQILAGFGQRAR